MILVVVDRAMFLSVESEERRVSSAAAETLDTTEETIERSTADDAC